MQIIQVHQLEDSQAERDVIITDSSVTVTPTHIGSKEIDRGTGLSGGNMSDKPSHMGGQVVETCLTEATKQTSVTFMRGKGDNTTDTADGTTEYIYI